ncbi:hypothetical protein MHBO_002721 [Bonamia ostreae]|uniref:Uncharacterized protein n=1 Tax=Bonamia ostreae TaxID=126728 RepID=A0ABV2AN97_9EUKA
MLENSSTLTTASLCENGDNQMRLAVTRYGTVDISWGHHAFDKRHTHIIHLYVNKYCNKILSHSNWIKLRNDESKKLKDYIVLIELLHLFTFKISSTIGFGIL